MKIELFRKLAWEMIHVGGMVPDVCIDDLYHLMGNLEGIPYSKNRHYKNHFTYFKGIWDKIYNKNSCCPDVERWTPINLMIRELAQEDKRDLHPEEKIVLAYLSLVEKSSRANIVMNFDNSYPEEFQSDYDAALYMLVERHLIHEVDGFFVLGVQK